MDRTDPRYLWAVSEVRKKPQSRFCFLTGEQIPEGGGDPAHVLPVSIFPEFAYRKANIVIITRRAHNIIDQGTSEQIARLPRIHNWLAKMRALDQAYYEKFYQKIEPYMTAWH